ncbi:Uncharacterized protein APZ42_015131 [Daphnia magna]|uniref:Uncharacterized protein n=1 Tax=Daphnia magna TaxID=35525 RepID=A0A162P727_9CRUS|nr:Uncharacterized protein APZ42_015131 [Daphnia magna]
MKAERMEETQDGKKKRSEEDLDSELNENHGKHKSKYSSFIVQFLPCGNYILLLSNFLFLKHIT